MRQFRMFAPLLVLAIGFGFLMLSVIRSPEAPPVYAQSYLGVTLTARAEQTAYPIQTKTAAAILTQVAAPTNTRTPVVTVSPTPTLAATLTSTLTPTAAPLPTFLPLPTLTPLPSPTAMPAAGETLVCVPGAPVLIEGKTQPRVGLLLYFAGRAVSGGVADGNGQFGVLLNIGNERPGTYVVAIYVRGSWQEVLRTTCTVPTAK